LTAIAPALIDIMGKGYGALERALMEKMAKLKVGLSHIRGNDGN
jgi:hypothetical protein